MTFIPIFLFFCLSAVPLGQAAAPRPPPNNETKYICPGPIYDDNYFKGPQMVPGAQPPNPPTRQSVSNPFKILFLLDEGIADEDKRTLEIATKYVQEKLMKVMKGPRLDDIRMPRHWQQDVCDYPAMCLDERVPDKYAMPCPVNPNPEGNIPRDVTDQVSRLNGEGYSLVVYLLVFGQGVASSDEDSRCHQRSTIAYAGACASANNARPSHGAMVYCKKPSSTPQRMVNIASLHETLHVILPLLIGFTYPGNPCAERANQKPILLEAAKECK